MSFDAEFDYTPAVNGMNANIVELQSQIDANTLQVNQLTSSPYASLVPLEIANLNIRITNDTNIITSYNAIKAEITRVNTLSVEEKALIYYFYSVLGIPKNKYMIKLLFNTDKLSDTNVQAVYNDTITEPATKLLVAQLLYEQFSINNTYIEIFNLYSYL
jgi:hypothetical protein